MISLFACSEFDEQLDFFLGGAFQTFSMPRRQVAGLLGCLNDLRGRGADTDVRYRVAGGLRVHFCRITRSTTLAFGDWDGPHLRLTFTPRQVIYLRRGLAEYLGEHVPDENGLWCMHFDIPEGRDGPLAASDLDEVNARPADWIREGF